MHDGPEWTTCIAALFVASVAWLIHSRLRIERLDSMDRQRVADRAGLGRFSGDIAYLTAAVIAAPGAARHLGLLGDSIIAVAPGVSIPTLAAWLLPDAQDDMVP
ncbi:hypothetical protein [Dokdonella sp.]|uniref:hypothetical protein n=1 Tax=Dokdonella sp. TaxID=2291710 RepID=UPI00261B494B|nr:hypothetical protein [Dokdonella sp.]